MEKHPQVASARQRRLLDIDNVLRSERLLSPDMQKPEFLTPAVFLGLEFNGRDPASAGGICAPYAKIDSPNGHLGIGAYYTVVICVY